MLSPGLYYWRLHSFYRRWLSRLPGARWLEHLNCHSAPIDTPPCSKHLKPPGVDEWQGDLPFAKVASGSYIESMRSVGLKTLKNKLSEYIRLAAGGETVLVTDRDRVVAEIGPPGPSRSPLLSDALLIDAFRQGWMTPPISVGRGPPQRKPVMTIDELLSNLQRDRADR
jgi:antitoxin (DNA-binding transcriptional repressor) of toxin-antitoxin stability system